MSGKEALLTVHIPTQSANAADEWYAAFPHVGTWRIKRIMFAPATAVAVEGTNYIASTITGNDGAGGADSSAIASHTNFTGGTAHVLKTTIDLALTWRMDFTIGTQIKIAKTVTAAGQILDGTYTFAFEKIN